MNSIENLQIISEYGDHIQLAYGAEFGYYASQMDCNLISKFCSIFNDKDSMKLMGFALKPISSENPHTLCLQNLYTNLNVNVKLLDHSVFIQAKEDDWKKINKDVFNILQISWRKFLAINIVDYRDHFNNSYVLTTEHSCYSI